MSVEVAFALMEPKVVGVKEKVPEPEPQAVPVLEMVPFVLNVAQPAVPPADETMRLVVDAVPKYPVPETVSAVEDA